MSAGEPVHGVRISEEALRGYRGETFRPDAVWQGGSDLSVYFKSQYQVPDEESVAAWRRELWNTGSTPLLWVVSSEQIDIYNGFGRPRNINDASRNLLHTFENIEVALRELDAFAGRIAMETGQFWEKAPQVNRKHTVDQRLLSDLSALESKLKGKGMSQPDAQELIGRAIFLKYLVDRGIVSPETLREICGESDLSRLLNDTLKAERLFSWLRITINGDVFSDGKDHAILQSSYLGEISRFFQGVDPKTGQASFFPYQFNIIPVELISAIYEQFAHSKPKVSRSGLASAKQSGIYYTPLSLVSLVLDEVMLGITGNETVLDLTCGSGVFLVEALRRIVTANSQHNHQSREVIRRTMAEQIYGVDISETAVRVATLSLYLCALDLDPDPYSLGGLRFEPLIGKNMLVGDARSRRVKDRLQLAINKKGGIGKFDIIVGNPPWTYRGKEGTRARTQEANSKIPRLPRGEALDFVFHAIDLAHSNSKFGIVLSATPFFSRSGTGHGAVSRMIESLLPITIVNLSNLSAWLFDNASMPSAVVLGRHATARPDHVTAVQVAWSSYGSKSRSFEISPSDVIELPFAEWKGNPDLLKAAFVGRKRDIYLVNRAMCSFQPLGAQLESLGTKFHVGLTWGDRSKEAIYLRELPVLAKDDLRPFRVPSELPTFECSKAERPRDRKVYRAPLVIVKEFLLKGEPRLIVGVAEHDLVFTNAYYGATFSSCVEPSARMLAGILSSSFASWYFLMTASAFGLWMRNLRLSDLVRLPVPDLLAGADSAAGRHLIRVCSDIQERVPLRNAWGELDEAVLDFYQFDRTDRIVVQDGLLRAGYQWDSGRAESMMPATNGHLTAYAGAFLEAIGSWLSSRNSVSMRAEILDLPVLSPLRIVRFVLEDSVIESTINIVDVDGTLNDVVRRIGARVNVRLSNFVTGRRELRVHGEREVIIIKPSARRHWLGVAALEDADTVIGESISEPHM